MGKRKYKMRRSVDWYDAKEGLRPKHNQKDIITGKYWNELRGEWGSKKTKRKIAATKDLMIYNFKYYPIASIEKDFGVQLYEKVAMFLSMQYDKQLGTGYKVNRWDLIYWDTKHLRTILSYNWEGIINKLLDLEILKISKSKSKYHTAKSVRYFMLNHNFIKVDVPVTNRLPVKDERYFNSLIQFYKKISKDRNGILKYIESVLLNSHLIINDLDRVLDEIWNKKVADDMAELENEFVSKADKKAILIKRADMIGYESEYKAIIKAYYDSLMFIQRNKNITIKKGLLGLRKSRFGGRISHLYSNAPKAFREYLRIGNEDVTEIDIKASQPSFLCLLFERGKVLKFTKGAFDREQEEYIDMIKYLSLSDNVDIYRYMAYKLRGKNYLNNDKSRGDMKKLFYKIIFGNPKHKIGNYNRKDLCTEIFGGEFYRFIDELARMNLDVENVDSSYKNLSFLLQKAESKFLLIVMNRLIDNSKMFLPLYDSLIVKKSDADFVKSVFCEVIEEQGLTNILRIK